MTPSVVFLSRLFRARVLIVVGVVLFGESRVMRMLDSHAVKVL